MPTNGDFPWEQDERRAGRAPRRSRNLPALVLLIGLLALTYAGVTQLHGASLGSPRGGLHGPYIVVRGPWRWRWVRVINPAKGQPHYVRERYRVDTYTGYAVPRGSHSLPRAVLAVPGPWHWRRVRVAHPAAGRPAYLRERYRTIRYVPASATTQPAH